MKKKSIIIIPIIIAVLVFIGLFMYIHRIDSKTNLDVKDRNWIRNNSREKYDLEIVNNIPLFSQDGSGVVFDFISDFEIDTNLEFNKIAYSRDKNPTTKSLRVRILNNDTNLSDKDLLIAEDGYILVSTNKERFDSIDAIGETTVGVFTNDAAEVGYYLKDSSSITYKSFDSVEEMKEALDKEEIKYMLLPQYMYLKEILENSEYSVNYYFTEMSKKIVLTLTDNNTGLNKIVKKYFEKWKSSNYVSSFNEQYLKYYVSAKKMTDKAKADMLSKSYVYGYVENMPYEKNINGKVVGIASEYINRLQRLTDIDIEYKKYSSISELQKAITEGKVDFYFNYFNLVPSSYNETISPFIEKFVVLRNKKNTDNVTTFEELKGKNVNMLSNNVILTYMQSNSKANITIVDTIKDLHKDNNLVVVDYEIYNYYKNDKFKNYEVLYMNTISNDYSFGVSKSNSDIYNLFNYIITTNSYYNYRINGLHSFDVSIIDVSTFQQLYLIILGIILLPILVIIALVLFLKNRKKKIVVRKEDRRKYTDILTSLKNRNYLNLNMQTWQDSKVYPQTIIMIDLNNMKYVNDNYGHEAGDSLIIAAASTLVNTQLENSEIIRTDGNEFLIYLVGYTEKQIDTYCKKLTKEFKELPYGFGAALGYSMILDDIKTIDDAINEATIEMKTNKEEIK